MTWSAVLLVTAVVWAVSVIRSVRVRAFVYSLPLPMTLALLTTGHRVDGPQLLGVVGLNLFFVTVAVTHRRLRWPILLADLAGVAAYVALSAGVLAAPVPFEAALVATVALWALTMVLLRHRAAAAPPPEPADAARDGLAAPPPEPADARRDGLAAPVKLVVIFVGALLTGLLGELLRGMVVTFPYSGVLVAVEARRQLAEFSRHFARNSLALIGFLAGHHYLQDTAPALALAGGWAAFALVSAALHLPRRRPARPAAHPGPERAAPRPGGRPLPGPERPAAT
ncbi:hypothetical protein [Micromonospora fulviviridis]|uniref:Uncharacterized protein n=1 Tax=Micromonospora fulviviridis TaxID=47860 RepID=A0ABV2VV89_9ACTN